MAFKRVHAFYYFVFVVQTTGYSLFEERNYTSIAVLSNKSCSFTDIATLFCSGSHVTEDVLLNIRPYAKHLELFELHKTVNLTSLSKNVFTNISTKNMLISGSSALQNIEEGTFSAIKDIKSLTISHNDLSAVLNGKSIWTLFTDLSELEYLNLTDCSLSNASFVSTSNASFLPNLQNLVLDSNPLHSIGKYFFGPFRLNNIQKLSLLSCKLVYIHSDTFMYLNHLKSLVLDNNIGLFTAYAFHFFPKNLPTSITYLSISYNEIEPRTKTDVLHTMLQSLPNLNTFDLSGNYLNPITLAVFVKHENLNKIILSDCKLLSISSRVFSIFSNIEEIDLTNNFLKTIPESLISSKLKILKIGRPRLNSHIEDFVINPNITSMNSLQELSLHHLHFNIKEKIDIGVYSPYLKYLKYENCVIRFEGFTRNLKERGELFITQYPNLKALSFENSVFKPDYSFKLTDISKMKYLEELNLSGITLIPDDQIRINFTESKLKKLILQKSLKSELEKYHLEDLKHLEEIDLSYNEVDTCKNQSYFISHTNHPKLKRLILRGNRIPFCLMESMVDLFCNLKYLDMSNTIFKCSENLSYLYVISKKCLVKIHQFHEGHGYFCQDKGKVLTIMSYLTQNYGDDTFMPNFKVDPTSKHLKISSIAMITGFVVIILLGGGLITFKIRSNWLWIKFLIAKQNKELMSHFHQKTKSNEVILFEYDAFVSFDSLDEEWIEKYLLPKVESNGKMKLCIHTRDFIPGKSIAENIVDSLERSRKYIIILSDSYVESKWCRFEYQLATDFMQRQPSRDLILIKKGLTLESKSRMIREISLYLCTHTYIEWTNDKEKEKDFWNTLRNSLKK